MVIPTVGLVALDHRWGDGPGPWSGPGSWWVVFPILWLALIATAITLLVLYARRRGQASGPQAGERRLAERYAAGEIDEDEYRSRLATLRGSRRS